VSIPASVVTIGEAAFISSPLTCLVEWNPTIVRILGARALPTTTTCACAAGSYPVNYICTTCDVGFYCSSSNKKACPLGKSTNSAGSSLISNCSVSVPTLVPTANPTINPSKSPTFTPSFVPTYALSAPTPAPTLQPSAVPTLQPSSYAPTVTPSSNAPSFYPTSDPSTACEPGIVTSAVTIIITKYNYYIGYYLLGYIEGLALCEICLEGTYSVDSQCSQCPQGKISGSGANECIYCPSGTITFTSGSSKCTYCPAGFYSSSDQSQCLKCADGEYSPVGSSTCTSLC